MQDAPAAHGMLLGGSGTIRAVVVVGGTVTRRLRWCSGHPDMCVNRCALVRVMGGPCRTMKAQTT